MANISVCRSFSCPYWSDGKKSEETGSIGGYGCEKFSVAGMCPVSQVEGVSDTQCELFAEEGGPQHRDTMIVLRLFHLVFRDMGDPGRKQPT